MPVLDFSDIEEQEKLTPAVAPAPLDFSDIEESDALGGQEPRPGPGAAPQGAGITFDDIVGEFATAAPGPGAAPSLDPATYLKGSAPSFQMTPSDEDQSPGWTKLLQRQQEADRQKGQGLWGLANEPLIPENKRKEYTDWLSHLESKMSTRPELANLTGGGNIPDLTGMRSLLELSLGPEKAATIRAGVTKGAADLAFGFTSPLGIGTLGMGVLPKAVQKAAGVGFAVDMARHLPDQVEAIGNAQTDEEKTRAITGALGAATMIGLLGKHSAGRPEAGGRIPLGGARIPGTDITAPPVDISKVEASGAPATAAAIDKLETTPPPLPEAAQPPPIPSIDLSPGRFKLPKQAESRGDEIVWVDVDKFDPMFKKDTGFYVEPGGAGESNVPGRYESFEQWVQKGEEIETPEVSILDDGRAAFSNGRNRYAWLRDHGVKQIPVAMDAASIAQAQKHGLIEPEAAPAFVPPETSTTLDPAKYPAARRPVEGLKLSKEVPNFKANADPETGVVEGQQLEGVYDHLAAGNIVEWVRNNGDREVITGRHRFDLARRTGEPSINTQQVFESEGWTPERVARLDAEINIKDEKGTIHDFATYFRGNPEAATGAEAAGLLARAQGKRGHKIGTLASADLFARFQAEKLSEQHALAIVEAAGTDAGAQRFGMRYVDSHPRATMEEVGNRVRASTLVDTKAEATSQGEFWDSGDATMAAMDKAADAAAKFQAEKQADVRTLTAALGKSDELKLTANEAKKFKIHDPNSVLAIRKALEQARAEAAAWENWHLDSAKTAAVLERSGTAKQFAKAGPDVADAGTWAEAVGARFDRVNEQGDYQFTLQDEGKESTIHIPARQVTAESVRQQVEAKRAEMQAPSITSESALDDFFKTMGIDKPEPPARVPDAEPPAKRPTAEDVVETTLNPEAVEVPEGALSVGKFKGGGATGTVVEYPDRIVLKDLVSLQEGQGGGSAVIDAIKAKGKPVELVAGQRTTDSPIEKLTAFYKKRGFVEVEGSPGHFRWDPVPVDPVKMGEAYRKAKAAGGHSFIHISDLQKASGIPMDQLKNWLRAESRAGRAHFAKGDWSLSSEEVRKGAVQVTDPNDLKVGQPELRVQLVEPKPEESRTSGAEAPSVEPAKSKPVGETPTFKKSKDFEFSGNWIVTVPDGRTFTLFRDPDTGYWFESGKTKGGGTEGMLSTETRAEAVKKWLQDNPAPEDRPLPQAAGASNITELQESQNVFAADVFTGLARADGETPSRDHWQSNFLRHYPELEDDAVALDRAWTVAQAAHDAFVKERGRKPMPAVVQELMGAQRGAGVTGIKNDQTDIVARERNLPARMAAARRPHPYVWDEAMRYMEENPQAQDGLVQRLREDPFSTVTDRETAMLLQRQIDLETKFDSAVERVNESWDAGDESAREIALADAQTAENALIDILEINRTVGTRQGQSLAARKMMGNRDYTLARMVGEARRSKGGEPLSPEERTQLEKDFEGINDTQSELEARIAEVDTEKAQGAADDAITDLKEQAAAEPEYEPAVLSLAERIRARLQKAEDEARVRLSKKFNQQLGAVPDVTIISDLAIIAASKIGKGVLKFTEFSAQMIREFGEKVEPYLQKAWDEADRKLDQAVRVSAPRAQTDKVKAAVKTVDQGEIRQKAVEGGKRRMAKEDAELGDLRPYVQKLALSFVRSGLTEREPLVDAVHSLVKEVVPDIDRRQTMDLISGYGDFAQLDPEAAKVKLRDIKGQLQQVAKLEDIVTKQPLQKSGVERRSISDLERRLQQQVNEAKRKHGVVTTDPARQLKGAVDAIKTRLKNQIKDLTAELETGSKPAKKTQTEYDAEAQNLKAVRDRVQATLDEIQGKPEMTDEQRLQVAMRAVEKSIAEYDRKIATKDFSGEGRAKAPTSVQLDALKARRDALKAEFEELRAMDEAWQEERQFDALMNQADALAAKLKAGDVAPERPGPKAPDTALVAEARARLAGLRKELTDARKLTPEAQAAKVEAAVKAVERSIAGYYDKLGTGKIDPVTKKPAADTPALQALKAERDALRKFVEDLRRAAKPKLSREEIALKSLKTRLLNENAELQAKMAKGDFSKKPVQKVDLSKDPKAVALKAENERIKKEFEKRKLVWEKEHRTGMERLKAGALEVLTLPRALKSSFDVSAVLRQGGVLAGGNPKLAATAIKSMFEQLFSEQAFEKAQAALELRPNARNGFYKAAKLFLADRGDVRLTAKEEAFLSDLAEKIPGIGRGVRASNRAYIGFLNRLRADAFDSMVSSLEGGGIFRRKGSATAKELKAIANYINIATGRGGLGSHAQAAQTLAQVLFSPRLLASRFQLLLGQPLWGGTARTRLLIAQEYAKSLGALGVVLSLGAISGATIEWDPRSSDFGKMKIGNTRIDMLAGLSQVTNLISTLASGTRKTLKGEIVPIRDEYRFEADRPRGALDANAFDVSSNFLHKKLAPIPSAFFDTFGGENVVGEKVVPFESTKEFPYIHGSIPELVVPLSFGDIYKVMKENGVPAGSALTLLSLFGASMQVIEEKRETKRRRRAKAEPGMKAA